MQRRELLAASLLAALFGAAPAAAADADDPWGWVVRISNEILDAIRADEKLHSGDADALRALVDRQVMPSVDFTMMTRMTVGPKWRQATKEDRARLMTGFERLLIRVYAGALANIKDHRCELRPTRSRKLADELVVRTLLKSTGQPDIGLDYRIYRNKAGEWKIVDVNVEGIWMVENYRSQFASTLNQDGIPGLIRCLKKRAKSWPARMRRSPLPDPTEFQYEI